MNDAFNMHSHGTDRTAIVMPLKRRHMLNFKIERLWQLPCSDFCLFPYLLFIPDPAGDCQTEACSQTHTLAW